MARRAELFVRELTDEEAAHLLKQARRGKNAVVRHRAMLLFASFQGQSVTGIAMMFRASATHVAGLIHDFNERGFACLDPRWGGGRPRRIDPDQRTEIVKAALARPTDRGEPFTSWSLTKLRDYVVRAGTVPTISRSQLWRVLHEAGIRFQHHKPGSTVVPAKAGPAATGSATNRETRSPERLAGDPRRCDRREPGPERPPAREYGHAPASPGSGDW